MNGDGQKLPNESHLAFWVMQLRTRSASGLVSQAFMKSPCIDDAMPLASSKPELLPLVG